MSATSLGRMKNLALLSPASFVVATSFLPLLNAFALSSASRGRWNTNSRTLQHQLAPQTAFGDHFCLVRPSHSLTSTTTTTTTGLAMVMEDFSIFTDDNNDDDGVDFDYEEYSDQELLEIAGDWDDKIARYNSVHLTGRIGNDPDPRYFDDGSVVVNLSLASRRKYVGLERVAENIQSWEDEETEWYGLEIWGQTAEFVHKYVDKGARVGVVGSLQVDEWTDRETGEPRQKAKVVVRDFDLLETKAEAQARRAGRQGGSGPSSSYGRDDDGGYAPAGTGGFFG